jgi:hypothetical protein
MQVIFESCDPQGQQLHAITARFVMRRLNWLVSQASVRLSDINGPRGGVDKRCQVEFRTRGGGAVVITALACDWRGALENALGRAARLVIRSWRRRQLQGARSHAIACWP